MNVKEKVIKIIKDQLSVVPDLSQTLTELGADSLDGVEIMMELEDTYGIEIIDEDSTKWKTVQDIVNYMENRIDGDKE